MACAKNACCCSCTTAATVVAFALHAVGGGEHRAGLRLHVMNSRRRQSSRLHYLRCCKTKASPKQRGSNRSLRHWSPCPPVHDFTALVASARRHERPTHTATSPRSGLSPLQRHPPATPYRFTQVLDRRELYGKVLDLRESRCSLPPTVLRPSGQGKATVSTFPLSVAPGVAG
jgi:hypothetical protein